MFALKDEVKETKLANYFYPYKSTGFSTLHFAFDPLHIVSKSSMDTYLEGVSFLNEEEKKLFKRVFGVSDDSDSLCSVEDVSIGPDKTEGFSLKSFVWVPIDRESHKAIGTFVNFVYFDNNTFYAITPTAFSSKLKSQAFNTETGKIDKENLKALIEDEYNTTNTDEDTAIIISSIDWKSTSISLSKVLIAMYPNVSMDKISKLKDFIDAEILASNKKEKAFEHVYELRGDAIVYFYNVRNYQFRDEGSLGNSCMRHSSSEAQITFYANNPTNVALLTYINDKKLYARAVLWTDMNGGKSVDRIYCSSSRFGNELAAYCKSKGYSTVYRSTSVDHNIPHNTNIAVKLDQLELTKGNYPYLDSMSWIDLVNNILSTSPTALTNYLKANNYEKYIVKNISAGGPIDHITDISDGLYIKTPDYDALRYLLDSEGKRVTSSITNYTVLSKPTTRIVHKSNVVYINGTDKVDISWCKESLIKKYNSLRPVLRSRNGIEMDIQYFDKQYTVYSYYHKAFILRKDAKYVGTIKSFVLQSVFKTMQEELRLLHIRKVYTNKLVQITEEGIAFLRDQINLLPFGVIMPKGMQPSRIYCLKHSCIQTEGVIIRGLLVPFKYIKFVRK